MPLSWNEIKTRAAAFIKEWEHESSEDAEAKSFWDEFFDIFGIKRRRLATFEVQVKKLNNQSGYIDLFWPGTLIVEHKSRGKSLDKAHTQVLDYFHGIDDASLPKYILVSDFARFRLYDLDEGSSVEFPLSELLHYIELFSFIANYQKRTYKEQDPVNIEAAELMGAIHDQLKAIGYTGHALELYLVRLLFCLFADDTGIFERGIFMEYIETKTAEDGSDLARAIAELFQVLNTPPDQRLKNLDESLAAFPYVNGKLFEEQLPFASFDGSMRRSLIKCAQLDWGKISPAIFGSLFQSIMDEKQRRNLGAHYTSEKNILKVIKPLFLDELWQEFEAAGGNQNQLRKLHQKISQLKLLDPACGCGNFLIIAYRELRQLELEIIKSLLKGQQLTSINSYFLVDVHQFYGIEYEEFPAQIAQVAMWLIDHQMNMAASLAFGEYYVRLPLQKSAVIVQDNALRIEWQSLINPRPGEHVMYDYIFGNPPFIGKHLQNAAQKEDMALTFQGVNGAGVLDYVAAWYIKAAQYISLWNQPHSNALINHVKAAAFVSTNSIAQGEQVGVLWNELFNRYHIKIHFAHQTFKWGNEAKGNAAVHVVIIGFSNYDVPDKKIYQYPDIKGEPLEVSVKNINPYLVEGKDIFIVSRSKPICSVPPISYGSMANDNGYLLLSDEEKNAIIATEPEAGKFIKQFLGSNEFINNINRWCIWLKDVSPEEFKNIKSIINRVAAVREYRLKSTRPTTVMLADYPTLFGEIRQPSSDYLLIPGVSSENRRYIPIGFLSKDVIASDLARTVANANLYLFGVLTSQMHMTWVKYVCGRLKSDFRYSNSLVYNNFPWPENVTEKQVSVVSGAANEILSIRDVFYKSSNFSISLADLYNANTMPPVLVTAHRNLDRAVDLCYRPQPFPSETKRIEYLFELYDKYTAGLFAKEKPKRKK